MKTRATALTKAFSLIEVTLSVGIAAFGVLSVVGLLPIGLSTLRESKNQMLEAQMLQGIAAEWAMGHSGSVNSISFYDADGLPVSQDQAEFKIEVDESSDPPVYPGSDNAFAISQSLTRISLEITDLRTQAIRRSFLLVADSGK